jgi:hypothetical protein
MDWALFGPGGAYTLRHCGDHGGGTFSPGEVAFRHRQATDSPSFTVVGKFDADLGPIDLFTHYNMAAYNPTKSTVMRLRCWDNDAGGVERTMYLKGVDPSKAFKAANTQDVSTAVCSQQADFSGLVLTGADCMNHGGNHYNDASHTYWGNSQFAMDWALFGPGGAYTLRHCGDHGGGTFSPGEVAFYF